MRGLLLLLLAPLGAASDADACAACRVVAAALDARLAAEGAKNDLDLRGRLGPVAGQRSGKKVAYVASELRAVELFEGLCDPGTGLQVEWVRRADAGDGDDDDAPAGLWIPTGAPAPAGHARVPRAEGDGRAKALENACARVLAAAEEAGLAAALAAAGAPTAALLCERLTASCEGGVGRGARDEF